MNVPPRIPKRAWTVCHVQRQTALWFPRKYTRRQSKSGKILDKSGSKALANSRRARSAGNLPGVGLIWMTNPRTGNGARLHLRRARRPASGKSLKSEGDNLTPKSVFVGPSKESSESS